MESVAVGLVGEAFGLSALDAAVLGVSQRVNEIMSTNRYESSLGRRGGSSFADVSSKRQRVGRGYVNNTIGHYKGDFDKVRTGISESALHQYGSIREIETHGAVSCPDVQYITVQSVNLHLIAESIATAYVRMILWRHLKQTYPARGSILFENSEVGGVEYAPIAQIRYIVGSMQSDDVAPVKVAINGTNFDSTTTLGVLIDELEQHLLTDSRFGFIDYTGTETMQSKLIGYQLVFRNRTEGNVQSFNFSPVYYTENQHVSLSCMTVINLQNTTKGDSGGMVRDAIDANPVVGRVFTLKGRYPLVEQAYLSGGYSNYLRVNTDLDSAAGVVLPTIAPTGPWRSIPTPQTFSNIVKCESGLRLEPGDIKKDVLRFTFSGTFRALMDGIRINKESVGGVEATDYDNGLFGMCKLFAFEKVVPTGVDVVEMNLHLDRYVSCVFGLGFFQHSVHREFQGHSVERLLAPPE